MKTRKIFLTIIVVILLISLLGCVVACNKDKEQDNSSEEEKIARSNACNDLTLAILGGLDSNWGAFLTNEEVATLDNCGDYVVAYTWTIFAVDVVKESNIQTAKIRVITDYLLTADGIKILSESKKDVNLIATLMRSAGLTSDDVKNVVYDGVCAIVNNANETVDNALKRLAEIKTIPQTEVARVNLLNAVKECKTSKQSIEKITSNKETLLSTFASAENGFKDITAFIYKAVDLLAGDENLVNKLSSGTLANITTDEIVTYLKGVMNEVTALKNSLSSDELASLYNALDMFVNSFDGIILSSEIATSIIDYIKYANLAVVYIPTICDMIENLGSYVLAKDGNGIYQSIENVLTLNSEEYVKDNDDENSSILLSRFVLYALGINPYLKDTDSTAYTQSIANARENAKGVYNSIISSSNTYQKVLMLVYLDSFANGNTTDKYLDENNTISVSEIINIVVKDMSLTSFKRYYVKYVNGDDKALTNLRREANDLKKYYTGDSSATIGNDVEYNSAFYDEIVSNTQSKILEDINKYLPYIEEDLNSYIDYFFDNVIDSMATLATKEFVKIEDNENYEKLEDDIDALNALIVPTDF